MVTIGCLQTTVTVGPNSYPLYVGFLPATDLLLVAEAPAFTPTTSHESIAHSVLTPPVKDWQRPIDPNRVREIGRVYNNTSELMPNPVLLAENPFALPGCVTIQQQMATPGVPTRIWDVQLALPAQGSPKPLWILDGQHRIHGLGASPQSGNPIPVVILLNAGTNAYAAPHLAKIFAQVTTEAQKLDDLHNAWLTFGFKLKEYAALATKQTQHNSAMEVVAELCRKPVFTVGSLTLPNPFHNAIRFNIHLPATPAHKGFRYSCTELKDLILKHYYGQPVKTPTHLSSTDLAAELAIAYEALFKSVQAPHHLTVFFGDGDHEQRIMQDAFLIGCLHHVAHHGVPRDWTVLLRSLLFDTTDWNFKSWTKSLSGSAQTVSRQLAESILGDVFRVGALPAGSGTIADYLKGNNAQVTFSFSPLTPKAHPSKTGRLSHVIVRGNVVTHSITPCRHVAVKECSKNIGVLSITDKKSPPGRLVEYRELYKHRGMTLDAARHSNPLELHIRMAHYGGHESSADLDIQW